jgi:FkbH-like protein
MFELPWMLAPPADFNNRCAALGKSENLAVDLKALVNFSLTLNQCNRLYRNIKKFSGEQQKLLSEQFSPLSLGIVSNATVDLTIPALIISALRKGILLEVINADFGQVAQEAFDAESTLNKAKPDLILLALDYRAFPFASNTVSSIIPGTSSAEAFEYVSQISTAFTKNSGATTIIQTLAVPPNTLMGNIDRYTQGTLRKEIITLNQLISDATADNSDILFDVDALASEVGTYQWFDSRQWLLSRVPMANNLIVLYAERLTRIFGALRGKSKKCLVLDLDNTVWGGVIGDDGLEGILLEPGSPRGESHLSLQQYALELKNQGVILAVCSKNDIKNALQPFQEHPDMLLKESDIAVFVANWQDKASNIRGIAKTLNIGIDSLVFVDDNPAEREVVRQLVPEVSVPELPNDAALYVKTLNAAGYFEMINFTAEDSQRAEQYAQNTKRAALLSSTENMDDYLASLDMEASFSAFDDLGKKRITQLINKTNQFNLTTQRYTEEEVSLFQHDENIVTLQVRLKDRFGDNGMISLVICKPHNDAWLVDTWLMSCRVIKRKLEESVCDQLVALAKLKGINEIIGVFKATEKNSLVANHYQELGFVLQSEQENQQHWLLNVAEYQPKNPPMKVVTHYG